MTTAWRRKSFMRTVSGQSLSVAGNFSHLNRHAGVPELFHLSRVGAVVGHQRPAAGP